MIRPFAGVLDPDRGAAHARAALVLPTVIPGAGSRPIAAGSLLIAGGGCTEVDGVLCAIDGAIYNGAELAAELGTSGEQPVEATLVRGYRRWGAGLAPRLRGEFTLFLWERREQRGLLIPDQLGVRRIVLRRDGRRLWFSSEVRQLLALLPSRPGPDPLAISHWLTSRPAPDGRTVYEGVECLGPGRMLELDLSGGTIHRYWQPCFDDPLECSRDELLERIETALSRAVARRMTPGAPIGILMSGGLDSTSVAVLAQRASADGACGFSATFPDYPHIDESRWIEALESGISLPGIHLAAKARGILASGLEYLAAWELPLHAWNEAWTQPLLRQAAQMGVTAMLSGEGGDELFGSRLLLIADLIRGGHPISAVRYARGLPEAGGRAPRRVLARVLWQFGLLGVPSARAEAFWERLAIWERRAPWWAGGEMAALLQRGSEPSWRSASGPRWWAYLTHALTEGVHGFGLFDHVRRRSEQAGVEARHPLFDLDLLELMLSVPPLLCAEGSLTRPLLRDAMSGLSPDPVRLRPDKSVFDDLVTDALVGPELPALRELLSSSSEVRAYTRAGAVEELVENPPPRQRGDAGAWGEDVLRLAAIELWLRYQEDRDLPARLLESSLLATPEHRLEIHGSPLC